MLQKLYIRNYAIIDELEIGFLNNLNIITGETGAGKSILLGALGLILGERADTSILQSSQEKCKVEGFFDITHNNEAKFFLKNNDLDVEDKIVLSREISPAGKSRAFVNDTPVNLNQLKTLGTLLVDLHQQFDTLELNTVDFQREVLDALADNKDLLQQLEKLYKQYVHTKNYLEEIRLKKTDANKELDYNKFLFNELEEANFKENELEELEAEMKILNNAENIKEKLSYVYAELKEGERPIVQQLKILANKISTLSDFNVLIPGIRDRLLTSQIELQDIVEELENINESIAYNPERINIINDKIALGYKLLKKHNVSSTGELLAIKNILQQKIDVITDLDDEIVKKEKEFIILYNDCKNLSITISDNRKKATGSFVEKTNKLLAKIGMPNARFKIDVTSSDSLQLTGIDSIGFLFDGNLPAGQAGKSDKFEPIRKVASGGELSRLMLCIKSLVAKKLQLPTLIFDEIDTGISGEAAKQVGIIMQDLAKMHQLIAITHQPQIAAKANAHYFIYKFADKGKITTAVRLLNNDERIKTIAQMLGGENPTAAALQNAKEMINIE